MAESAPANGGPIPSRGGTRGGGMRGRGGPPGGPGGRGRGGFMPR